jgi:hypothetical protein
LSCKIDAWRATATGEGEGRVIMVSGDGECGTPDHELRLEPTNEGVVDDPEVAALRLVVIEPEVGPEVMTPEHVETEIKGDPAIRVRIDTEEGSRFVEVEAAY